jgi:hypothetical protein
VSSSYTGRMDTQSMLTTISTGPRVFRGLGDVITDVLASGIHRETPEKQTVSFDITECRRRTFATIYQVDKYIATLFDLPSRLSRHYSNVVLPLDLSYDELFVERIGSEEALRRVGDHGWSKSGKYTNSTSVRLRYILARVREEILDYQLYPLTTECKDDLKLVCHNICKTRKCSYRETGIYRNDSMENGDRCPLIWFTIPSAGTAISNL